MEDYKDFAGKSEEKAENLAKRDIQNQLEQVGKSLQQFDIPLPKDIAFDEPNDWDSLKAQELVDKMRSQMNEEQENVLKHVLNKTEEMKNVGCLIDNFSVYTTCMHLNSVFNTVVTVVVVFIMLRKTPESMKTYKWYLINAAVCCFALDIFITLFFVPVTVLPWILGGCATGLLKPLGPMATVIGWVSLSQLLGMCGFSLNFTLLYRLAAVYNKAHLLKKKTVLILMAFIQIFYTTPTIILVLLIHPPEDKSLKYVKENHPNLFDFYSTHSCSLITIEVPPLMPYIYLAIGSILLTLLITMTEMTLILSGLRKMKNKMSERSYRMHKQLTTAIFIQLTIPGSMLTAPYLMFAIAAGWQLESAQFHGTTFLRIRDCGPKTPAYQKSALNHVRNYENWYHAFFRVLELKILPNSASEGWKTYKGYKMTAVTGPERSEVKPL
ncbi:serpentine type 7TM GPCR chemoreceptor srh domain-containing protein [Ditylenchus destructor]|nr:serpentine type 7TM GPCR chemoreceptor srh domain-containing protein [Ditylenchus destructor]